MHDDGPVINVRLINVDGGSGFGQNLKALIDTGSDKSLVYISTPKILKAKPISRDTIVSHIGGSETPQLSYRLKLVILDDCANRVFEVPNMQFTADRWSCPDRYEVILGRDFLKEATFTYNGPNSVFTLSFPHI